MVVRGEVDKKTGSLPALRRKRQKAFVLLPHGPSQLPWFGTKKRTITVRARVGVAKHESITKRIQRKEREGREVEGRQAGRKEGGGRQPRKG